MLKELFTVSNYQQLHPDATFANKLLRIFKTYGLVFLAMIAVAPLLMLADKFVTEVLHHKSLNDLNKLQFQQLYKKLGKPAAILFICLVGPIFEELVFRLSLKFKKREVAISASVAIFYFSSAFIRKMVPANQAWVVLGVGFILLLAAIVICLYFIPDTTFNITDKLKRWLTVCSILLFGLMHASNYHPIEWGLLWIYPIYVLPQLLMGWGITYVRLKNGFTWGIAMHCLINSVSTLLSFHLYK